MQKRVEFVRLMFTKLASTNYYTIGEPGEGCGNKFVHFDYEKDILPVREDINAKLRYSSLRLKV